MRNFMFFIGGLVFLVLGFTLILNGCAQSDASLLLFANSFVTASKLLGGFVLILLAIFLFVVAVP